MAGPPGPDGDERRHQGREQPSGVEPATPPGRVDAQGAGCLVDRRVITEASRPFWTGGAQRQLLILWCAACELWVHPPRETCPGCDGALVPRAASGRGRVFTFTVNRHAYNPAVPVPYVIAIVELEEQPGLRFITNIVGCDPEAVRIGLPVQVDFEPAGEAWAPVFRPAEPAGSGEAAE